MPTSDTDVTRIKGLLPAVDSRVIQPMYVQEGTNFYVDMKGPRSGFGSKFVSYEKLANRYFIKTFRFDRITFVATKDGIYTYNTTMAGYQPVHIFDGAAGVGPWSFAKVAGKAYFCRKGFGVFEYDPDTLIITTISNFPSLPVAITQSFDRLVVLCEDHIAWSEQGNGQNMTADIATGAGSQRLASFLQGDALAVFEVEDGFISYTTDGILKSELTEIGSTYRHFPLTRQHHAINAFAITEMQDYNVCCLTEKGLYVTDGSKKPELFQGLHSEHLSRNILMNADLSTIASFALFYSIPNKMLFVSYGIQGDDGAYSRADVYYEPRDEWGSFDTLHYGFGELALDSGALKGFNFGYICSNGYVHKFDELAYRETRPLGEAGEYFYQIWGEFPARRVNGTWYLPSVVFETPDETVFIDQELPSGMYSYISETDGEQETIDWNALSGSEDYMSTDAVEDWNSGLFPGTWQASLYQINQTGLASRIKVGLYKLDMKEYNDEISQVSDVTLGMSPNYTIVDYMLADGVEDWNTLSGDEDWGLDPVSAMIYEYTHYASDDGIVSRQEQIEVPYMNYDAGQSQFYKLDVLGKYHSIELQAVEVGETFHLKSLEITGTVAGRAG